MEKKLPIMALLVLIGIIAFIIAYPHFNNMLINALDDPNAILPPGEGLVVVKREGTVISFGFGYVSIVKENGELWIWGMDGDPSANDGYERTSKRAWKLAEQVAAAVPVGMDIRENESYLSVLYEDASLWVWDITIKRDVNRKSYSSHIILTPEKIMEGVSAITANGPRDSSLSILKTNRSLWGGWKKGIHGKGMDGVYAIWVNPVEYPQTYILKGNDELYGFGENTKGVLGIGLGGGHDNPFVYHNKPTKVTDSVASVITQGEQSEVRIHTMAIKNDHSLWLWGRDIWFDLSSATNESAHESYLVSNVPVKIMEDVASGAMGVDHSLVVKRDGSLWVWGYNEAGQVGIGTYENVKKPVKLMDNVASVTASNSHSLALQIDGSLYAWGNNRFGQLGTGDTTSRLEPTKIMEDVVSIFTTATCNAAVKRDGSIWLWGNTALYPGSFVDEEAFVSILEPICILEG